MNTNYCRVIPRDLFNEAKLLKCVGRLVLLILDGKAINGMTYDHDDEPFKIGLLDDGFLAIRNITFELEGRKLFIKSLYNSKNNYSLYCEHEYCDYLVFEETGEYSQEFIDLCNNLIKTPAK